MGWGLSACTNRGFLGSEAYMGVQRTCRGSFQVLRLCSRPSLRASPIGTSYLEVSSVRQGAPICIPAKDHQVERICHKQGSQFLQTPFSVLNLGIVWKSPMNPFSPNPRAGSNRPCVMMTTSLTQQPPSTISPPCFPSMKFILGLIEVD